MNLLLRRALTAVAYGLTVSVVACDRSRPPRPALPSAVSDGRASPPRTNASDTPSAAPCRPAATAAELTAKARAAAASVSPATLTLTPPLPMTWPSADGAVSFFAYQVTPLPTGRIIYRTQGPLARIDFPALDASPTVTRMDPPPTLGDEERGERPGSGFQQRLDAATAALVEVVAGCQTADSARADLEAYREWLQINGVIERDLRQRVGEFLTWLDAER